jgi:hypothetical protein
MPVDANSRERLAELEEIARQAAPDARELSRKVRRIRANPTAAPGPSW